MLPCQALFFITATPQKSDLPASQGSSFAESGGVKCDQHTATGVPGLFVVPRSVEVMWPTTGRQTRAPASFSRRPVRALGSKTGKQSSELGGQGGRVEARGFRRHYTQPGRFPRLVDFPRRDNQPSSCNCMGCFPMDRSSRMGLPPVEAPGAPFRSLSSEDQHASAT